MNSVGERSDNEAVRGVRSPGFFKARAILTALSMAALLLVVFGSASGCGDVTDRPQDCTEGEYFNEAQKLCMSCAAPVEPTCRSGCGFRIVKDDNGCAVAECALECSCPTGEFFSTDSFSCESCAEALNPPEICAED